MSQGAIHLRLLLDMNLSPEWVTELAKHGIESVHWSTVGDWRAADSVIMSWARSNEYVVLTHDLDFGTLLALTHADGPSVVQIRIANILPQHALPLVVATLRRCEPSLATGALVVIDEHHSRVRLLPIR